MNPGTVDQGRLQLSVVDPCRGNQVAKDLHLIVGERGGVYIYDPVTQRRCRIPWMHVWKNNKSRGQIRTPETLKMMSQDQKEQFGVKEQRLVFEQMKTLPELTSDSVSDELQFPALRINRKVKLAQKFRKENPKLGEEKMKRVLAQNRERQKTEAFRRKMALIPQTPQPEKEPIETPEPEDTEMASEPELTFDEVLNEDQTEIATQPVVSETVLDELMLNANNLPPAPTWNFEVPTNVPNPGELTLPKLGKRTRPAQESEGLRSKPQEQQRKRTTKRNPLPIPGNKYYFI